MSSFYSPLPNETYTMNPEGICCWDFANFDVVAFIFGYARFGERARNLVQKLERKISMGPSPKSALPTARNGEERSRAMIKFRCCSRLIAIPLGSSFRHEQIRSAISTIALRKFIASLPQKTLSNLGL